MRLALLACLLLASCGGSGAKDVPCHSGGVASVAYGDTGTDWGHAIRTSDCETVIRVNPDVPDFYLASVIAHELWHAVGFDTHNPVGCLSSTNIRGIRVQPPCEVELEQMYSLSSVFVVKASPALRAATLEAVQWWNYWVQREMFVLG